MGKLSIQMVMVNGLYCSIPHDRVNMTMTLIKLSICHHLPIFSARTIDTKAVERITKQRGMAGGALIWKALPGVTVVMVLLRIGVTKALISRDRIDRAIPITT